MSTSDRPASTRLPSPTSTSTTTPLSGAARTPVAPGETTNGPVMVIGQGANPPTIMIRARSARPFRILASFPPAAHFARISRQAALAAWRRFRRSERVANQRTIRYARNPIAPKIREIQP